jgi:hypothetical protein
MKHPRTLVTVLCLGAIFSATGSAHELKDGFVERSFSVVVQDGKARCQYSIGLNDVTMNDLIDQWSAAKESSQSSTQASSPKKASTPKQAWAPIKNPSTNEFQTGSPETTAEEINQQKPSQIAPNSKPDSSKPNRQQEPKSSANNSRIPVFETQKNKDVHWLDPEKFKSFQELAKTHVVKNLKITCDKKMVEASQIKIGPPPRHPFYLVLEFEFDVPASGSFDLEISDLNFLQKTGARRDALKTRGKAMILNSNVAPTIIRAKRIEITKPGEQRKNLPPAIIAKIATPKSVSENK